MELNEETEVGPLCEFCDVHKVWKACGECLGVGRWAKWEWGKDYPCDACDEKGGVFTCPECRE